MSPTVMWVVVAAAIVVVFAVVWFEMRRRSQALRGRFGPEYERAVEQHGSVRTAEAELGARAKRVERLHIRPLTVEEAGRFSTAWLRVQERFVDDPGGAVAEADRLIGEVMAARGYPVGDFEQRVADISVDHADVVINYRAARDIALEHGRGKATTEDLRQAMVHYRALFADLLAAPAASDTRTYARREQ